MKKTLLPLFLLIASFVSAQQWQWVQKIDGPRTDIPNEVNFLPDLDLIVTGIYEDQGGVRFESSDRKDKSFTADQDTFQTSHSTLFVARYKPDGRIVWTVNAFAENGIHPWDSHTDKQGNIIVSGNFRGTAIFHSTDGKSKSVTGMPVKRESDGLPLTYYVVKYNSDGVLLWVRIALGGEHAVAFEAQTDDAGNVYVKGYSHYNSGIIYFDKHAIAPLKGTYNLTLLLVKYTADGDEQWILSGGNASYKDLRVLPNGEFMVRAGYYDQPTFQHTNGQAWNAEKPPAGSMRHTHFHFNTNGELLYGRPGFPALTQGSVEKYANDKEGNYYTFIRAENNYGFGQKFKITLNGRLLTTDRQDIVVAKFDKNQNLVWVTQFRGGNDETMIDITVDVDGNPIVAGSYYGHIGVMGTANDSVHLESELQTTFIAQLSTNGAVLWACNMTQHIRIYENKFALDLNVNSKNQLFAAGQLNVPSKIGRFMLDVKGQPGWNSPGWEKKYTYGQYTDAFVACMELGSKEYDVVLNVNLDLKKAAAIVAESASRTVAAVDSAINITSSQTFTYTTDTSAEGVVTKNGMSATMYPNPAISDQTINVQLELSSPGKVTWTIFDPTGKLVSSESDNYETTATYQFSTAGYTSGVYLLVIDYGIYRDVKKLVIY